MPAYLQVQPSRNNTFLRGKKVVTLFCLLFLILVTPQYLFGQTSISGIINDYTAVLGIEPDNHGVTVSEPAHFQPGDTVLLIQMKGMSIILGDDPVSFGRQQDANYSGHYEFLLVDEVIDNIVVFTRELLNDYSENQALQLVRVRGFGSVTVTGTLEAAPWDGEKGGVLAIIVTNTLSLNADIDVSARGFRGGSIVDLPDDDCSSDTPEYTSLHFAENNGRGGMKGEGPVSFYSIGEEQFPLGNDFVYGYGRIASGGGGGNGLFSGGGGGSNVGIGGFGGNESEECPSWMNGTNELGGVVGNSLTDQLFDAGGDFLNRLYMGGGGGGSTSYGTRVATAGGHGGGIAIILANYIESSGGGRILADGGSVTQIATAGAGGGGAGGTIVASIDNYIGNISMYARGGKGGDTGHDIKTGPGGGGGGGAVIHSGEIMPPEITPVISALGSGLSLVDDDPYGTTSPSAGGVVSGLELTLNGLLFNGIRTDRLTICEATLHEIIEGTQPRGGDQPYSYKWLSRPAGSSEWTEIEGAEDMHLAPDTLFQTTEFIRVVEDTSFPAVIDSSNILIINVQPRITGNIISDEQTICEGETPLHLSGDPLTTGGTGIFEYQWSTSSNAGMQWSVAVGDASGTSYYPPALTDSTWYVRVATSGECVDTSNMVVVNVHPFIGNNILMDDQVICHGAIPLTISAVAQTTGGAGEGSYSYSWESVINGDWTEADGDAGMESYSAGTLIETISFRRRVVSGACTDTSPPHLVTVLPLITGNTITGDNTICMMDAAELSGQDETGGGDGNFRFKWEMSGIGDNWETASGDATAGSYTSPPLSDPQSFRRIVFSGEGDACKDTSNISTIDFFPGSFASIVETSDTICTGSPSELEFSLSGNSPFILIYSNGTDNFTIDNILTESRSVTITPETIDSVTINYSIVSLTDSFGCRAIEANITGNATVTVYAYPDTDAGAGGEFCGLSAPLNAIPSFGRGIWESPAVGATFSPRPDASSVSVAVEEYGTHTFRWTETNWRCPASSEVSITFYEQPVSTSAGNDQNLHYIFETQMNAALPAGLTDATGMWELIEGSGTVVFPYDPYSPVTGIGFGENLFKWTVTNGVCEPVSDIVTIRVTDLSPPTGFSPNQSGLNDRFIIRGLENASYSELIIFNRQGNVVYRTENYMNDWEGRNQNGVLLPEDTYYYILNVDNRYTYKGFLILKR